MSITMLDSKDATLNRTDMVLSLQCSRLPTACFKSLGCVFFLDFSQGVQQLSKTGSVSDKIVINEKRLRKLSLLPQYLDVFLIKQKIVPMVSFLI